MDCESCGPISISEAIPHAMPKGELLGIVKHDISPTTHFVLPVQLILFNIAYTSRREWIKSYCGLVTIRHLLKVFQQIQHRGTAAETPMIKLPQQYSNIQIISVYRIAAYDAHWENMSNVDDTITLQYEMNTKHDKNHGLIVRFWRLHPRIGVYTLWINRRKLSYT